MAKGNGQKGKRRQQACIRSDARTLHVDFENFSDGLICARNAGVIIDYRTQANVLNNFGFKGRRCAHISIGPDDEVTRLRLVRAYDAPPARGDAVLEFVYRPARHLPVTLKDWPIVNCFTSGGAPGEFELKFLNDPVYGMDAAPNALKRDVPRQVAIGLRADGTRSKGTWSLNVVDLGGRTGKVLEGLDQCQWIRFILHRHDLVVDLYAGPPGQERFVGTFTDLLPGGEIHSMTLGNPEEPRARGSGYWDSFRLGRLRKANGKVAPPEPVIKHVGEFEPQAPKRLVLGSEKHLVIDDWFLEETRNVQRTFHRPVKHRKNPLLIPDRPWESQTLYLFGGIERQQNGHYRMWYSALDPVPGNRKNAHVCLATSTDGIHWEKPEIGIHEYKGSKKNNILILNVGTADVFTNPDDPRPDFRYLAKVRHQGTQGWTSADGLIWNNHGIIIPQSLDASTCHWDPVRRKYIAAIKLGYKSRRYRGYAESDDFLHWTDTYLMTDVDHLDAPGDQVYQFPIFRYESLYLALCKIYHVGTTDTCDTHLAISHNCQHWKRPYRPLSGPVFAAGNSGAMDLMEYPNPHTQPFLTTGPPGEWDFGNNDCPSTPPIRDGDHLRFYYCGRYRSHSQKNPVLKGWKGPKSTIGLATLRLDGFVSADADASGGYLLTKPLRLDGKSLFVNANAEGGRLQVEILNRDMKPLPGFKGAEARAIRSDKTRVKCTWKAKRDIASLAGKTVRIKFGIVNASLFSYWCE